MTRPLSDLCLPQYMSVFFIMIVEKCNRILFIVKELDLHVKILLAAGMQANVNNCLPQAS